VGTTPAQQGFGRPFNVMVQVEASVPQTRPEPLPDNIRSVQPGGGVCYRIELAWGRARRWYLKTFRPGYVRRMARVRQGDPGRAPHEIVDSRDLKYCRNLCDVSWPSSYDRFAWREKIPLARWGLAEIVILGLPLLLATLALSLLPDPARAAALVPAAALALLVYFFRDPPRAIPTGKDLVVAPADGKIVEVTAVAHDDFVGGPAIRIGIFLSIFNVHINRAPAAGRVVRIAYAPGQFLNALKPESALRNEAMWIGCEQVEPPYRRWVVRQISGLIARRIVCALRPGQVVGRGERFGMIKLGSRTELIVPSAGLQVDVAVGARVRAGSTVLARFVS